jgi:7,8-dihydro-6-hydroxymethylpterin-pyrophosphokinase
VISQALVAIVHNGAKNIDLLKHTQQALEGSLTLQKLSSVYEVKSDFTETHQHTEAVTFMGQSLCYVMLVEFDGSSKQLHKILKEVERKTNLSLDKEYIQVELLSFDDEISMLPTLTLPHPELHQKAEFLVPSSEILPTYEHPVIEKTLVQIESTDKYRGKVHFYAQSKNLTDFTT